MVFHYISLLSKQPKSKFPGAVAGENFSDSSKVSLFPRVRECFFLETAVFVDRELVPGEFSLLV